MSRYIEADRIHGPPKAATLYGVRRLDAAFTTEALRMTQEKGQAPGAGIEVFSPRAVSCRFSAAAAPVPPKSS
jgi:hypothetical protein